MREVLDQSAIDALLGAMEAGEVQDELTDVHIFSRQRRDFDQVDIKSYDFRRPERIGKDQMRALETLHDAFARGFGAFLTGFLRIIVEVRVAHAEQMTYSEFIAGLPNPTCFNTLNAEPLEGQMCLELSPLIIYPIIDRLLGGTNQDLFIPQRAMTTIEGRLIRSILEKATEAFSEAWEGVRAIRFTLGEMESNPQIVQFVAPNEVVIVIGFEIKMSNRAGTMSLCIPFKVIEPLIDDLSSQRWIVAGRHPGDHTWENVISGKLGDARIEVTGVLGETTVAMSDLRRLEVGDVLTLEKGSKEPVILAAEGRPKYMAQMGQYRGHRALRIVREVTPEDRVG